MSKGGLKVSRPLLGQYLRAHMGATYRLVKPIQAIQNSMRAKLQRQLAAAKFIEALSDGLRVVNIDESAFTSTDHRKRGWVPKDRHNMVTTCEHL